MTVTSLGGGASRTTAIRSRPETRTGTSRFFQRALLCHMAPDEHYQGLQQRGERLVGPAAKGGPASHRPQHTSTGNAARAARTTTAPSRRRAPVGRYAGRLALGSRDLLDFTCVEPEVVAEFHGDTAVDRGRWRYPIRLQRLRTGLAASEVPTVQPGRSPPADSRTGPAPHHTKRGIMAAKPKRTVYHITPAHTSDPGEKWQVETEKAAARSASLTAPRRKPSTPPATRPRNTSPPRWSSTDVTVASAPITPTATTPTR